VPSPPARIAGTAALAGIAVLGTLRALAMVPGARYDGLLPAAASGPLAHVALHPGLSAEAWLTAGMVACYVVVAACGRAVPTGPGLAVMGGLLALYALVPPAHGHDVFAYVAYARMGALHGVNPYLHGPRAMGADPVSRYYAAGWRSLPTKYGPLFTLVSYAAVPLGVMGAAWALKLATALAAAVVLVLVAAAARRVGQDRASAVRFVGLNPLLLAYAVGKSHNDVLMAAALVAGVTLLAAGREGTGAGLGVVAAAIKPSGVLAVPFLVLGARSRRRALAGAALAAGIVLAIGVAAFGVPVRFAGTLAAHEASAGHHSVAWLVGLHATTAGRIVVLLVFLAAYAALLVLAWRRRMTAATAAGWAMAAVLALSTVVFEWYLAWLVPLAALSPSRRLRAAALALTVLVTLVWPARSLI
jgi:alpha-1,6-mannosyltransferase